MLDALKARCYIRIMEDNMNELEFAQKHPIAYYVGGAILLAFFLASITAAVILAAAFMGAI